MRAPHLPLAALALFCGLTAATAPAFAQGNGRLQIHFMNVGQGDAAILISPNGQTVLFDNGNSCQRALAYLQQLGVHDLDYHVASHYHSDHIGCTKQVLDDHPVRRAAIDRGRTYESEHMDTFNEYIAKVGNLRQTATPGMTITLDPNTAHPVAITFRVVNGVDEDGTVFTTRNENDLSVVATVRFGAFDAVLGGDLSGANTGSYRDVETHVASRIGRVEVYKVNHHGSQHSSNDAWLAVLRPLVGIISAGVNNSHKHPTEAALNRLRQVGTRTYWTTGGKGIALPQAGHDVVGNNIIVEAAPGSTTFTVTYNGTQVDTYQMIGTGPAGSGVATFAWSTRSDVYHFADCSYVASISPTNLAQGNTAPANKRLHNQCPRRGDP